MVNFGIFLNFTCLYFYLHNYTLLWFDLEHDIQVVTQNHNADEEANLMKIEIVASLRGLATLWGRTFAKFLNENWSSFTAFASPGWSCVRGHPFKYAQAYLYFTSLRKELSIIITVGH